MIKKVLEDYKLLLRSIPASTVTCFVVSVILMNLLANKELVSLAPGMWGAYYDTGSLEVNTALNATIGGSWYVVLGSSLAMLCSSFVNSHLNQFIGHLTDNGSFATFALRSYVSTGVGQLVDNLVFAIVVSHVFFGWTWLQVITCSITGALAELACEVLLSPVGFKVAAGWEREGVGDKYVQTHAAEREARA